MPILVEEDNEFLQEYMDTTIKYHEENNVRRASDGLVHIGDITYCARKAWIPYIFPLRNKLDIYEVDNFDRGLGTEYSIVKILDYRYSEKDTDFQMEIQFDGITGHPDFTVKDEVVFELKSTNTIDKLNLKSDNIKSYVRQVVYYMLLTGIETGRILIKYNLPFHMKYIRNQKREDGNPNYQYNIEYHHKNNRVPYYFLKVTIPKDDPLRHSVRDILVNKIKPLYKHVLKNRDLTVIPTLPDKKVNGWKCRYCKHNELCSTIPDRQTDPELRGFLLNEFIDKEVINKVT